MKAKVSIHLDTRRVKKNDKYPVKLNIYDPATQKKRLINTGYDLTKSDFKSGWESKRVPSRLVQVNKKIRAIISKAEEIINNMEVFTFDEFKAMYSSRIGDRTNVFNHFNEKIDKLKRNGQVGNAQVYENSMNSFQKYLGGKESLHFREVTMRFLNDYQHYMTEKEENSLTTVSMYVRALRALYNEAVEENIIHPNVYPFGKGSRKYRIPSPKKVKKALSEEQLKTLYNAKPGSPQEEKAKDFWFLSFHLFGMNLMDIARLRWTDLHRDKIEFVRHKTKSKAETKVVFVNKEAKRLIEKYGNEKRTFIFGIISKKDSDANIKRKVKNFNRFINQHIKTLCKAVKMPPISYYWARHSFATSSVRNGATLEFMKEVLGHSNLKTTQGYFAGFPDEKKREFAQTLTMFADE